MKTKIFIIFLIITLLINYGLHFSIIQQSKSVKEQSNKILSFCTEQVSPNELDSFIMENNINITWKNT